MSIRTLFIVTAALELTAGLALLAVPAVVIRLLFGPSVDVFPAAGIVRLTGAALLSLGAACWWARNEERTASAKGLVSALLIYNAGVIALGLGGAIGALGPIQLSAVVLHGIQAIWCAWLIAGWRR